MSETNAAITIDHVSKMYKLYRKPSDRLKDSLGLTRKKCYQEHYALSDVSFDIKKGETIGIIGTNGAGKSTLLKIITGVLSPTSGEVRTQGRISALLELGAGFNGEYTGMENIYLNGTMMGFTDQEIDARVEDILAFADIGDFIHQPVKTYSSGMFVRLAFAVAINIDPEILIVDEALSVGDVFFQAKCYRKFEDFKKAGKTILFVSHDLGSISRYCDRVVLLDHGRKLAEGGPKEMVNLYKRLIVHQGPAAAGQTAEDADRAAAGGAQGNGTEEHNGGEGNHEWILPHEMNTNTLEYGEKEGEIIGFRILDENGLRTNAIEKGTRFSMQVRVLFHQDIDDPIFTYTIKDIRGTEITGTNTMYEKVPVTPKKAGEIFIVTYEQQMDLQGGDYLLSFSLTGYRHGEFTVYHRLYDVCSLTVISDKNTVGFYDMNSIITLEREN